MPWQVGEENYKGEDAEHDFAENVVEDSEDEEGDPPSIFISYQWGFQQEVKVSSLRGNLQYFEDFFLRC